MKKKIKTKGQLKKSILSIERAEGKKDIENRMDAKSEGYAFKKGKK